MNDKSRYTESVQTDVWPIYDFETGWNSWIPRHRIDLDDALANLMTVLKECDHLRTKLETRGGTIKDIEIFTQLLKHTFSVESPYQTFNICLAEPSSIRYALHDFGSNLHFEARCTDKGLPLYYLARTRWDYWSEYSLIVEDLHVSPGYPMVDERFIKLMVHGCEMYFLRLSQFRKSVAEMLSKQEIEPRRSAVDSVLYELGRYVFQSAWHDDQRLGILVARSFDLPKFNQAMELLYLCLSGDLCELRNAYQPSMMNFFTDVYPQPAIARFLKHLVRLDGGELNAIPQTAKRLYVCLSGAFKHLLKTDVLKSVSIIALPLYKFVFANVSRLDMIAAELNGSSNLKKSSATLEACAEHIIDNLTTFKAA